MICYKSPVFLPRNPHISQLLQKVGLFAWDPSPPPIEPNKLLCEVTPHIEIRYAHLGGWGGSQPKSSDFLQQRRPVSGPSPKVRTFCNRGGWSPEMRQRKKSAEPTTKKTRNKHIQIETRVDPSRKMIFDLAFPLNINQD